MKLVTQLEDDGCLRACVAMIAGVDYRDVPEGCKSGYGDSLTWLSARGIESHPMLANQSPRPGAVYIVCAPSLNVLATRHAMVWDFRTDPSVLLDPNTGRDGKRVYDADLLQRGGQWRLRYEVMLDATLSRACA